MMGKCSMIKQFTAAAIAVSVMLAQSVCAFAGDKKNTAETAFIRARVDMASPVGMSEFNQDLISFSETSMWEKKDDGYFYYKDPLPDGATVELMNGLHIPESWTEQYSGNKFRIIITAEAAENMDGVANWADGSATATTSSQELDSRHVGTKIFKTTKLDVEITEYELDKNNNIVPYVNDKVVIAGDNISKIVKITVHVNADYDTPGNPDDREYDDREYDHDRPGRPDDRNDVEIIPLDRNSTEVIPIEKKTGSPSDFHIMTGDSSLMVPLAAAALISAGIIFLLIPKKKQKQDNE